MSTFRLRFARVAASCMALSAAALSGMAQGASEGGVLAPAVIQVKGAWPSATDAVITVPEGGAISSNAYGSAYFGLTYPFGPNWTQRYEGPPPSDSGYYVLAQIEPSNRSQSSNPGHVLIAAQDMFFTLASAGNAFELLDF